MEYYESDTQRRQTVDFVASTSLTTLNIAGTLSEASLHRVDPYYIGTVMASVFVSYVLAHRIASNTDAPVKKDDEYFVGKYGNTDGNMEESTIIAVTMAAVALLNANALLSSNGSEVASYFTTGIAAGIAFRPEYMDTAVSKIKSSARRLKRNKSDIQ